MAAGSSAGSIFVDLLLRDLGYSNGLNRARGQTKKFASDMKGYSSSISTSLTEALGGAALGAAAVAAAAAIVRLNDSYSLLEGRLSLVASSTQDLINTQERLYKISQDTRTDFASTATLYQRLSSATKSLGVAQEEVFKFTEQLNKMFIISGLTSAEASASLYQLTQALNKGKVVS